MSDFKDNLYLYCNIFGTVLGFNVMFNVKIQEAKPAENHWSIGYT